MHEIEYNTTHKLYMMFAGTKVPQLYLYVHQGAFYFIFPFQKIHNGNAIGTWLFAPIRKSRSNSIAIVYFLEGKN